MGNASFKLTLYGCVVSVCCIGFASLDEIGDELYEATNELSQRTQAAVQIVSNLPAPTNGGLIYRFLGMRTRWMAGAAAHKSG